MFEVLFYVTGPQIISDRIFRRGYHGKGVRSFKNKIIMGHYSVQYSQLFYLFIKAKWQAFFSSLQIISCRVKVNF